jgi:hypothetical protein
MGPHYRTLAFINLHKFLFLIKRKGHYILGSFGKDFQEDIFPTNFSSFGMVNCNNRKQVSFMILKYPSLMCKLKTLELRF